MNVTEKSDPQCGDMRVWWIPQLGIEGRFEVPVDSVLEGVKTMETLANYDLFQFRKGVKPDFANSGGIEIFDSADDTDGRSGSWVDWYDPDTGGDCPREWASQQGSAYLRLSDASARILSVVPLMESSIDAEEARGLSSEVMEAAHFRLFSDQKGVGDR